MTLPERLRVSCAEPLPIGGELGIDPASPPDTGPPWIDPAERAMAGLPAARPKCRHRFVMAIP